MVGFWIQWRKSGGAPWTGIRQPLGVVAMHRKGNAALTTVLKQAQAGQRQRLAAIAIKVGPLTIGEQGGQLGPASQAMLLRVGLQPGLLLCLLRCCGGLWFGPCRLLTRRQAQMTIRLIRSTR